MSSTREEVTIAHHIGTMEAMRDRVNVGWVGAAILACGGALWAGTQWTHPAPAVAAVDQKAAGAELFATRGCAHCHGANGMGAEKGPSVRDLRKKMSADEIRGQIVHGGNGMPAFGEVLQPAEIDQLVAFLRSKKWLGPSTNPVAPPAPSTPPEVAPPAPGQ